MPDPIHMVEGTRYACWVVVGCDSGTSLSTSLARTPITFLHNALNIALLYLHWSHASKLNDNSSYAMLKEGLKVVQRHCRYLG